MLDRAEGLSALERRLRETADERERARLLDQIRHLQRNARPRHGEETR